MSNNQKVCIMPECKSVGHNYASHFCCLLPHSKCLTLGVQQTLTLHTVLSWSDNITTLCFPQSAPELCQWRGSCEFSLKCWRQNESVYFQWCELWIWTGLAEFASSRVRSNHASHSASKTAGAALPAGGCQRQ